MTLLTVASNLLTQVTLPCTAAINELVVDTTHPAAFWTYKVNSAAPAYFTSTPLTSPYVLGTSLPASLAEVAIATSDAVTVYTPVTVNLVNFGPVISNSTSTAVSSDSNITIGGGTI